MFEFFLGLTRKTIEFDSNLKTWESSLNTTKLVSTPSSGTHNQAATSLIWLLACMLIKHEGVPS